MKLRRNWQVLLGLAGLLVAVCGPASATAECPDVIHFYRVVPQGYFDVWENYVAGTLAQTARFPAGASPTFFGIEDNDFYFYRVTNPSPFAQRWQLYRNDTLVGDFSVYNKQLTLARVECGAFYFYRMSTLGLYNYWELYRSPNVGAFVPPVLLNSFRFLASQQPTFFGVDQEVAWFYRNTAAGPHQVWQLYENGLLRRSFSFYNKVLTLATIDDGNLFLYKHTAQAPFDFWTLYRNEQLVQSLSFYNKNVSLAGVDDNDMFFTTSVLQQPFTNWQIYRNDRLACSFGVYNLNPTEFFSDECDELSAAPSAPAAISH